MNNINPLSGNAPQCTLLYFSSILLCLTPYDFTRKEESAATHWVNQTNMHPLNPISRNAPNCNKIWCAMLCDNTVGYCQHNMTPYFFLLKNFLTPHPNYY
jgi:hypothetical protein